LLLSAALLAATHCPRAFLLGILAVGALVILYDLTSKRLGLGKQLLVALLMASYYPLSFALVGATTASRVPALFAFPAWLFLTAFGYETLKDIRDIAGDQAVTPRPSWLQRHPARALRIARSAILAGAATLLAPAFLGCGWVYTAIIPAAIALAYWSTRHPPRRALPFIYAEVVVVGIAALGDIVILGS
jgi:4-hydroxybenzoate polyprenyltransferase